MCKLCKYIYTHTYTHNIHAHAQNITFHQLHKAQRTLSLWHWLRAQSSWKAIQRFSMEFRKGRVLMRSYRLYLTYCLNSNADRSSCCNNILKINHLYSLVSLPWSVQNTSSSVHSCSPLGYFRDRVILHHFPTDCSAVWICQVSCKTDLQIQQSLLSLSSKGMANILWGCKSAWKHR